MHLQFIDYALWLVAPCLQVGIAVQMFRRGLFRRFPFFFTYTLLQVCSNPLLVMTERHSYALYYYSYWSVALLSALISFGLMAELFRVAFQLCDDPWNLGRDIFHWALVVVIIGAVMLVLSDSRLSQFLRSGTVMVVADRIILAMLCGLALLLLICSGYLSISWCEQVFGIALGFSVFTFARLVVESFLLRSLKHQLMLGRVNGFIYVCSCVIWLAYAATADRRPTSRIRASEIMSPESRSRRTFALNDITDAVERKFPR
ncbi:MAG: hypothetical protein WBS19_08465 [Candidatus Korobacteraceae bacterium]